MLDAEDRQLLVKGAVLVGPASTLVVTTAAVLGVAVRVFMVLA